MIGATVSHYKILEKLGGGGMGIVYKARDLKLDRPVALKFLPPEYLRDDEAKQRFIQEAKAASALEHPNICTIHEVDETADGQLFIVMACYDGETLKKRIERGPMPVEAAIDIALQIASGLERAHAAGIIHRDIKPANIMLTEHSGVKIVDFGLAKGNGGTRLTQAGSLVGTVAYMSPEQAAGEPVDHQTDIWSLGVILYEMLAGDAPFKSESDQAVIYAILHEKPKAIAEVRDGLPAELQQIVGECMTIDSASRYQHVSDVADDLRKLSGHKSAEPTQTFRAFSRNITPAVLLSGAILLLLLQIFAGYLFFATKKASDAPLTMAVVDVVNETGESRVGAISGLLETALEQSPRLALVSRARMRDEFKKIDRPGMTFLDEETGREIARILNIRALAVATVHKFGQLYSIDLKVIEPQSGTLLSSNKLEGEGQQSLFSLVDQLSEKTRIDLNETANTVRTETRPIAEVTTFNIDAWEQYFKGVEFSNKAQWKDAQLALEKAIELDTTFAMAYGALIGVYGSQLPGARSPKSLAAARKALQFADRAPANSQIRIKALNAWLDENYQEVFEMNLKLLEHSPEDKVLLFNTGDLIVHYGHEFGRTLEESKPYFERAVAIDPTYEPAWDHIAFPQWGGRIPEAKRYVANVPTSVRAWRILAMQYQRAAEFDSAVQTLEAALKRFPERAEFRAGIGRVYEQQDEYDKAAAEFEKLLDASRPLEDQRTGYHRLTQMYAYQGKYRKLIELKERIIEIDRELDDAGDMASRYAEIAWWHLLGWGDHAAAQQFLAKSKAVATMDDPVLVLWRRFRAILLAADYEGAFAIANQENDLTHMFQAPKLQDLVHGTIQMASGDFARAIPYFQRAGATYELAECYHFAGQWDEALAVLQAPERNENRSPLFNFDRPADRPRTLYLLGRIYEDKGETGPALENYGKLLELWKDADDDLLMLIETKARYAALRADYEP